MSIVSSVGASIYVSPSSSSISFPPNAAVSIPNSTLVGVPEAKEIPVRFTVCKLDPCDVDAIVPSTTFAPPSVTLIFLPAK